jgi:hypothetical protein
MRDHLRKQARKYHKLRAQLVARGLTLSRWAIQNGYRPSTVYSACRGDRQSALSAKIIEELEGQNG